MRSEPPVEPPSFNYDRAAPPSNGWYLIERNRTIGQPIGHQKRGEQTFLVEHREDDTVVFTVGSFSRGARWFAIAGGPVTRLIQQRLADRYLAALSDLVAERSG